MVNRHFLTLNDLSAAELKQLLNNAIASKIKYKAGQVHQPLLNKTLAMVFDKSSTRTRVSFETGMTQLGGHAIFLSPKDTQLGRGEPIEDSARVLSRMVDIIMIRTFDHGIIQRFAEYATVPVINALTDQYHPCQLLADLQTYMEHRDTIEGKSVAWIGDGNNMCHSYINAAKLANFHLNIATPKDYTPDPKIVASAKDYVHLCNEPSVAIQNADLVVTDVWSSMGQEEEQAKRKKAFAKFQITNDLMQLAKNDALFMHCLPAHRGEEVSSEVMDSKNSVVWDEAENRLYSCKALLEFLLA
ncbi:MAG: ornithine carbamoyltransferase [Thiohalomonadales bacterium]